MYITPHLSILNLIYLFIAQPLHTPRPFSSSLQLALIFLSLIVIMNIPVLFSSKATWNSRTTQVC